MEQKVIKSNILLPLIGASYRDEYTEYKRRNLRCSDAGVAADEGEKCEREIYYDMKIPDKKTSLTSGTLALFDDGRLHEFDIRRRLRLVLRSPEKELYDEELGAKGKIDNTADIRKIGTEELKDVFKPGTIITDPILELKSVNEFSFQAMASSGIINQTYYDQIQYYLFLDKKKWAIVLIKNRNSSGAEKGALPFLEFIVLADLQRQVEIRAGLKTTKDCVDQNILPPRPFLRESTKCSYCRFKRICWPAKGEAPALVLEKEGKAPSQEILEGAMRVSAQISGEIAEKEQQLAEAKSVITRYFKATKKTELIVKNVKATYSVYRPQQLDKNALIELVSINEYVNISYPDKKLLEKAIADRKLDAGVLDAALKPGEKRATLRINVLKKKQGRLSKEDIKKESRKKRKEKRNANKKHNGSKKVAPSRASTTRNKGSIKKRKRVSKRG